MVDDITIERVAEQARAYLDLRDGLAMLMAYYRDYDEDIADQVNEDIQRVMRETAPVRNDHDH